jgi:hypothetical protein
MAMSTEWLYCTFAWKLRRQKRPDRFSALFKYTVVTNDIQLQYKQDKYTLNCKILLLLFNYKVT